MRGRDVVGAGVLNGTSYTLGQTLGTSSYTIGNANLPALGDQPIADRQPGLVMNYLIATTGIFPSQGKPYSGYEDTPAIGQVVVSADVNGVPAGFALCNGQLLSIQDNPNLYALIGTTYGGDGVNSFAVPDLRGRTAIGAGTGVSIGQATGSPTQTLTSGQLPAPTVTSITTNGATTNNNSSETFTVTFSDAVSGVDTTDFAATKTGSIATGAITVTPDTTSAGPTFTGNRPS